MCIKNLQQLKKRQKVVLEKQKSLPRKIMVCCGPGCLACGAQKIANGFKQAIKKRRIKDIKVESVVETGCHGLCEQGPLVAIEPEGLFYTKVKARHIDEIINRSIKNDEVIDGLLYAEPSTGEKKDKYSEIDFYNHQTRIALRNLGKIRPTEIDDYIAAGGYQAAAKAIKKMKPEEVIETVKDSGLRGRGGGGFATGRKWYFCRSVDDTPRYVICNGDEGDPGAFMDRAIMEGDPHTVLEGMMIAAWAVGAHEGYIYVREEYPLAVIRLQEAIEQARAENLLGENLFGTGFDFDIKIARGAGAFVCGESSALMKSVAGEVGEPRAKYVRSVVKGLYDKPTVLNNVESYANVPVIIEKGAGWFKKIGTPKSTGTKAFSLVGKVKNTGLIEVPMGMTLRQIIYDVGGGIIDDRPFKAVQTGGPSGGCLPESKLDLQVDFDTLTAAGSMMGSGGMIVMDDRTCMVDVAKYFLEFLVSESCGKCIPCREGLYQLHRIVTKITEGRATEEDLARAESLSDTIVTGSLCGLGQSGANPFLSTIQYFRDEYLTHIRDKRCPAGVCKELIRYEINDECTGCMACIPACTYDAITGKKKKLHIIDQDKCTKCGACYAVCTYDAIDVI
jgi:NADH-quinone oxidoreductase subunit F